MKTLKVMVIVEVRTDPEDDEAIQQAVKDKLEEDIADGKELEIANVEEDDDEF